MTYPPSLVEPSWHPVQIATHDAKGRALEVTYQATSTETLIGRYGYDAENRQESSPGFLCVRNEFRVSCRVL